MWGRGISALSALSLTRGRCGTGGPLCSGLAVGTGKARGLLWQHCESFLAWYRVIVFDFLSRNLCDHGLAVCCKIHQLFLQGTSGHFSQWVTGKDLILLLCAR